MYEFFPFLAGAVVAFLTSQYVQTRLRIPATVVLSIALGLTASTISGEVFESWGFVLVDTLFVLLTALATGWLIVWWESRASNE